MSEVDLSEISEKSEKREKKEKIKVKKQIIIKPDKKRATFRQPIIEQSDKFVGKVPCELSNLKNVVFRVISMPAKCDAIELNKRLSSSGFMNDYLDKYMLMDQVSMLNDHVKFCLTYATHFFESKLIKNNV